MDSPTWAVERQLKGVAPGVLEQDQTLAGLDQTLADADQEGSDRDQATADSDQDAADRDQAASDRDLVHGSDLGVHELTRGMRDRSSEQRRRTGQRRGEEATARDAVARTRDLIALARDQVAALRDRELSKRDVAWIRDGRSANAEVVRGAAECRERAAGDRAAAAEGRARAAADRERAARDRDQAARELAQAQADCEGLLQRVAIAETDAVTGTRIRAAGLADLEHEIDRARRTTTGRLVVAYVDVVGLKAVNDADGHAAGDALLRRAVDAIRSHLRSYDLIIRLGGDEFLCVMSGSTVEVARRQFGALQTALAAGPDRCEIKVGFAALEPQDGVEELIERADVDLPASRLR